jgi:hypothetical protein
MLNPEQVYRPAFIREYGLRRHLIALIIQRRNVHGECKLSHCTGPTLLL